MIAVRDEFAVRHLFTAVEAQRQLGIPAATVRSWARRKRVWSYGLNRRREPMYDRDDLLKLRDRNATSGYNRNRLMGSRQVRNHRRDLPTD